MAGTEGKLQLWPVLSSSEWEGWQVPGRREKAWRLSIQWSCWISGSKFTDYII